MASFNPMQLLAVFRRRRERVEAAMLTGMRRATNQVERGMLQRLGGHLNDPPGSYPVPNRTGNLFRGVFSEVHSPILGIVGVQGVSYAGAIHAGSGTSSTHGPRPFLTDAVEGTDVFGLIIQPVREAVLSE